MKADVLPVDTESEAAVLGLLLQEGEAFPRISAVLDAADFGLEKHRRIFNAMQDIYRVGGLVDTITVAHKLHDDGKSAGVDPSYLNEIASPWLRIQGADSYCKLVKETSVRRRGILAAEKLAALLRQGEVEAIGQAEKFLHDLSSETVRDRQLRTAGQIITDQGGLDAFLQASRATVPTPWTTLNKILGGGLRPEEMVIVAARTSVGKTAAALQIADHAGNRGIVTAVYSLEMGARQLLHRMACTRAGVDGNLLRHGRLNQQERAALSSAMADIADMPVYFDDTASCTVPAIHASLRRLMAFRRVGLVIVDYLQLVDTTARHENRTQAVSAVSRGLKLAAVEFKVPFVVLAQLSRAAEDRTEPQLRDLRESGAIEQDADIVMFLHRTGDKYGDVVPAKWIVAKQRNGPLGPVAVDFISSLGKFRESTEVTEDGE